MLASNFIQSKQNLKINRRAALYFWAGVFSINLVMLGLKLYGTSFIFQLIPLMLIILFCCFCLHQAIEIYFVPSLGAVSYSVYLFHRSYYTSLDKLGPFPKNSTSQLILYLITFPVFIFICKHLENLRNLINNKLISFVKDN